MANVLFIKFTSLPLLPTGENIKFKWAANPSTPTVFTQLTINFGAGGCPVGANVNDMATNLANFLDIATATGTFAGKFYASANADTVTITAVNLTSLADPLQTFNYTQDPLIANKVYQSSYSFGDESGQTYNALTTPNFSTQLLGAGSQVKLYAKNYARDREYQGDGWANCGCYQYSVKVDNTFTEKTYNVLSDSTLSDFYANVIVADPLWATYLANYRSSGFVLPGNLQFASYVSWNRWRANYSATVKFTVNRKLPGAKYATFSLTSEDTQSGTGRVVSLNTPAKTALFLSTDFLDLSGKNNQVAYRNPNFINFDDNTTTPSSSANSVAVLCKSPVTGTNAINSYEFGSAGGLDINSSIQPGWVWWERSYFIKDTSGGDNSNIYTNLQFLISQSVDVTSTDPGTKAIDS